MSPGVQSRSRNMRLFGCRNGVVTAQRWSGAVSPVPGWPADQGIWAMPLERGYALTLSYIIVIIAIKHQDGSGRVTSLASDFPPASRALPRAPTERTAPPIRLPVNGTIRMVSGRTGNLEVSSL